MAQVIFWGKNLTGHVAVACRDRQGNAHYLSFRPANVGTKTNSLILAGETVQGNFSRMDIDTTQRYEIQDTSRLNDFAVADAIANLLSRPAPNYNLYTMNCSHLALLVLQAGLSDDERTLLSRAKEMAQSLMRKQDTTGMGTVDQISNTILSAAAFTPYVKAGLITMRIVKAAVFLAAANRTIVPSPMNVVDFARHH